MGESGRHIQRLRPSPRACTESMGWTDRRDTHWVASIALHYSRYPWQTDLAQPTTHTKHESVDGMDTGAHQDTLVPPRSPNILLVHQNEASCHLAGHGEARRSCEPWVRACGPLFLARKARCWERPSEAWPRAGGGAAESIVVARISMLASTSRLDAPISSFLSLMPMSMTLLARSLKKVSSALKLSYWPCSSSSSWKSHGFCKHRATQHTHTIGGMSAAGPGRRPVNVVGRVVAYDSQMQDVSAGKKQPEGGRGMKKHACGRGRPHLQATVHIGLESGCCPREELRMSFEGQLLSFPVSVGRKTRPLAAS